METNWIETRRLRIYPASREEMASFIARQSDNVLRLAYGEMLDACLRHPDQWLWYTIWMIERKDGIHVGECCFKGISPSGSVEIGYGVLKDYQRQGYATEAVDALVSWALLHPAVRCVEAEAEPGNLASLRVLEKCAFLAAGINGAEGPRFIRKA